MNLRILMLCVLALFLPACQAMVDVSGEGSSKTSASGGGGDGESCGTSFAELTHTNAPRADVGTINLASAVAMDQRVRNTQSEENSAASDFLTNHRLVPNPRYDTDGRYDQVGLGTIRRHYLVTLVGRPTVVCGASGSIADRIEDCSTKNGDQALWDGRKYGMAGEGNWKLVVLTFDGTLNWEVWRDERTRLLWSDATLHLGDDYFLGGAGTAADTGTSYNWFQATGYSSNASTTADTGVEGRAGVGTDCSAAACQPATPISVCAEASLIAGYNGVATYANPGSEPYKGGLSYTSSPSVIWRAPTIEDIEQGNVDGIRRVLPNIENYHWSTTSYSNNRSQAHAMSGTSGLMQNGNNRSTLMSVRCVAGSPE